MEKAEPQTECNLLKQKMKDLTKYKQKFVYGKVEVLVQDCFSIAYFSIRSTEPSIFITRVSNS
jgi:hypothetical protein